MKKFVSLVAAGSLAFSLTTVSLAADANRTETTGRDCSSVSGIDRTKCLREKLSQRVLLQKDNMLRKVEKKVMKMEAKNLRKTTRRELMQNADARNMKAAAKRRSSSSMMSSSSTMSSSSSSDTSNSSSSAMSSSSSSVSSGS